VIIRIEKMLKPKNIYPSLIASLLLMFGSSSSQAADTNKGAELYAKHCASCHGLSGIGMMPGAPNFAQGEGLMTSDGALLISIQNGKAAMPAYRGVLSNQDTLNVIAYLRNLN
jgi:mono/diheme cytochrome c family protein